MDRDAEMTDPEASGVAAHPRSAPTQRTPRQDAEDRARAELLSNVAHELRTPLSSIKAYVTALLRRHTKSEPGVLHEYLEVINEETDRMTALVDDLVEMSRLEALTLDHGLKVKKTLLRVDEVIRMACNAVWHMIDRHIIEVIVSDDLPLVLGDPPRLERAIRNLIENAIRYSPDGSRIEVKAYVAGPDVVVAVRDEGIGIEPQHHDLVFERFFREDNEVTR
ncbi:MAG: histidine kinase dimerization/phospho-acceptor domain-containing protein, partial [Dehalococcoidia bacterium]